MNKNKSSWRVYWESTDHAFLERLIQNYKEQKGYEKLLKAVSDFPDGNMALEVGAGKGVISRQMQMHGWKTYAIDLDYNVALQNKVALDYHYTVGDMFFLPFQDSTFDIVTCCGLIEHFDLETVSKIIREMKRVGKNVIAWMPTCGIEWKLVWMLRNLVGGDVYTNTYPHKIEELQNLFFEVGFTDISINVVCFSYFLRYLCIAGSGSDGVNINKSSTEKQIL